jgi:ubiquitin-protein ligase
LFFINLTGISHQISILQEGLFPVSDIGELSHPLFQMLASKRLQKELKELKDETPVGLSLSPTGDSLFTWHGNVKMLSGALAGICFHVELEIPSEYPNKAPSLFFKSFVKYVNGAQQETPKGISICLDLLGNFASYHTEWGSQASGWCEKWFGWIFMLCADCFSAQVSVQHANHDSAAVTRCSERHVGVRRGQPGKDQKISGVLGVCLRPLACKAFSSCGRRDRSKERRRRLERQVRGAAEGDGSSSRESESVRRACIRVWKIWTYPAAAGEDGGKASCGIAAEFEPSLLRNHWELARNGQERDFWFRRWIWKFWLIVDLGRNLEQGFSESFLVIPSSSSHLTLKTAFDGGVRRSSTNEAFEFFLPIFISEEHFARSKGLFRTSVEAIYASMMARRKSSSKKASSEVQALEVICALMNTACVATSGATGVYHDRFIECYLSLLRLLKWLVSAFPSCEKHADREIQAFVDGARDKKSVPNLGEFLILFHASSVDCLKVLPLLVEEVDARNVRWFKDAALQSVAVCKGRLQKTFAETEVSRTLVCFQVKFLELTKRVDLSKFVDGMTPAPLVKVCKKCWFALLFSYLNRR